MKNKYLEKIALFGFSDKEKIEAANKRFHMDTWSHYSKHLNESVKDIEKSFDEKKGKYADHIVKSMKSNSKMYKAYGKIHSAYVSSMKKYHKKYDTKKLDPKVSMDSFVDQMGKTYKDTK